LYLDHRISEDNFECTLSDLNAQLENVKYEILKLPETIKLPSKEDIQTHILLLKKILLNPTI